MKEDRTQFRVIKGIVENEHFTVTSEKTYDEDRDAAQAFNEIVITDNMTHFARYNTYKVLNSITRADSGSLILFSHKILRVNLSATNNNMMLLLIEIQQ